MNKFIEKCINKRVDSIVEDYNFKNRRKTYPDECPCNSSGPCHDIKNLNCFFCYCPGYVPKLKTTFFRMWRTQRFFDNTNIKEGRCLIENPCGRGYYYDRTNIGMEEIWDCSDCNYPHTCEETINALNLIKEHILDEKDLKEVLLDLFTGKLIDREKASSED